MRSRTGWQLCRYSRSRQCNSLACRVVCRCQRCHQSHALCGWDLPTRHRSHRLPHSARWKLCRRRRHRGQPVRCRHFPSLNWTRVVYPSSCRSFCRNCRRHRGNRLCGREVPSHCRPNLLHELSRGIVRIQRWCRRGHALCRRNLPTGSGCHQLYQRRCRKFQRSRSQLRYGVCGRNFPKSDRPELVHPSSCWVFRGWNRQNCVRFVRCRDLPTGCWPGLVRERSGRILCCLHWSSLCDPVQGGDVSKLRRPRYLQ